MTSVTLNMLNLKLKIQNILPPPAACERGENNLIKNQKQLSVMVFNFMI